MVTLGNWYRDTVTQIVGVAIARIEHFGGSPEVKLCWTGSDDEAKEVWIQEGRCEAVTTGRQIGFRQEVSANGRVSGSH